MTAAYDAVRYPPIVHPQTHPDRLFVNATLLGLNPASVSNARVLELGCGDGSNLVAVAFAHPESQCVGFDTSGAAIAEGRSLAEEAGVGNLNLVEGDVMDIAADFGEFDYIIAHGLYSWVPPDVREKVMQICAANLAPQGVAYVSYSAYPGAHFRLMLRGMMQFHVGQFEEPLAKVAQAKGILTFIAEGQPQREAPPNEKPAQAYSRRRNNLYRELIRNELDHMNRVPPALVYHDDLSPFNTPVYFHEFAAHAKQHGLQYLSEADFAETQPPLPGAPAPFSPQVMQVLDQLPADQLVRREQYADFVRCRQFRQTLLCRDGAPLQRPPRSDRVTGLYAASAVRPVSGGPDLRSNVPEQFESPARGTFTVNHPAAKAALVELGKAWPRRLHFDELLARVLETGAGGEASAGGEADAGAGTVPTERVVADLLLTGYASGVIGLHAYAPRVAPAAGERPVASALARAQSTRRTLVTNVTGTTVELDGPIVPRLLRLVDGTRDADALARDLAEAMGREGAEIEVDGRRISDPAEMVQYLRQDMDRHLPTMARLGLLVE